jgi:hypothetical protein
MSDVVSSTRQADAITEAWIRVAQSTPRRARRRSMLALAIVVGFGLLTIPGGIVLWGVMRWVLRVHALSAIAPLAPHLFAIALALGLPNGFRLPTGGLPSELRRRVTRFESRAERLHALRQVLVIESALLGVYPLLAALVTHDLPRWGVSSVIAVASTTVVWPLERIARAQRAEGERLAALSD